MLYDKKLHLPQAVGWMLEDFRAGNVTQLEQVKAMVVQILGDNKEFLGRLRIVDSEHNKDKQNVLDEVDKLQSGLELCSKKLDKLEREYWDVVIGEMLRVVDKLPSNVQDENE